MNNDNNQFHYTFSAPTENERKQIENILRQYDNAPAKEEDKLEKLKQLDALAKRQSNVIPLVLGVVGCLIFGLGLTMVLEWNLLILGIIVSFVGSIPMALAYPVYLYTLKK